MTVTPPPDAAALDAATLAEIARVRTGALGGNRNGAGNGGGRLLELFDFLVARSAENRPPKETEIALAVFGKADNDVSRDDPVARVYIHRLRKRLEDFYLRHGQPGEVRLDIPRGEYRIVGVRGAAPADEAGDAASGSSPVRRKWPWPLIAGACAAVVVAANVAAWVIFAANQPAPVIRVADDPVWTDLAHGQRPLLIVVGDYYMFGEYEDQVMLKRLIRDFSINSKDDLTRHYMRDPKQFDRYSDVAMQYLPTSTAYALADLAPLMEDGRSVKVSLASELTPDQLKANDVIFVGLLSGLGSLRDPVFARSNFAVGESYDQIIDGGTGKTYTSEAFVAAPGDSMYRDYGFFSTFSGPAGNRIAILTGSRDTALMGVAEFLTHPDTLAKVDAATKGAKDFEMLFEVKGQKHINLEAHILTTHPIDSSTIWTGARTKPFNFPTE
jgi:hypothetical protein